MHVDHHPLINEFPEHRELIHSLKLSHHHFARLADEYENVDKSVTRIENNSEVASETHLEGLKKQRLTLKDQLYKMIQDHHTAKELSPS
jgi:uncharacterized protein